MNNIIENILYAMLGFTIGYVLTMIIKFLYTPKRRNDKKKR